MTTDRDRNRYVQAFRRTPPDPRPRPTRLAIYTACVSTAALVLLVAFGLLWIYTGGDPR